ncbi:MAG: hypothetical protein AB8B56_17060, partial [Crocinitomicaceae bacterium]
NEVVVQFEYQSISLYPAMLQLTTIVTKEVKDRWGGVYTEEEYLSGIVDFKGNVVVPIQANDASKDIMEEWFDDEIRQSSGN